MTGRQVAEFVWMLPRNAFVLVLRIYRAVISPLYGQVCRYYPSCSAYGLESFQQHGVIKGIGLTAWRVLRCNPWSRGGVDDVPDRAHGCLGTTRFGFVLSFTPVDSAPHNHAHAVDHRSYQERIPPAHA